MFSSQFKHTLILLRFPFSLFLMPLFFWALSRTETLDFWRSLSVFAILHGLVYPSSNGYNSLIDQDTEAIGGLEKPPPPPPHLGAVTLGLDGLALLWGFYLAPYFGLFIGFLILMSRLYSAPWPRLKQYPIFSFLLVSLLQGAFTFLGIRYGLSLELTTFSLSDAYAAFACSALVAAAYPLSQIFQHAEDAKRGDLTLSRYLGYNGTFLVSEVLLLCAHAGVLLSSTRLQYWIFAICLLPTTLYLLHWHRRVLHDSEAASFGHSLRLNICWALGLNLCFGIYGLQRLF